MSFETVKAGWLQRQSKIMKKWKRSWFVLTSDGLLRYFDHQFSSSAEDAARMKLDCIRISTGHDIPYTVTAPDNTGRDCMMQIEFSNKTWILCAETPDDMLAWKLALEDSRLLETAQPARSVTAPVQYPRQQTQVVHTVVPPTTVTYPNNVVYVNGNSSYMYPTPVATQQVIRHPNGNTTVIVNEQRPPRYYRTYGYGLGPLWW